MGWRTIPPRLHSPNVVIIPDNKLWLQPSRRPRPVGGCKDADLMHLDIGLIAINIGLKGK